MNDAPPKTSAHPRDAASLILVRRDGNNLPRVLMGQRGRSARFMPSKFVFPGGALDPDDHAVGIQNNLPDACARRLMQRSARDMGRVLALSAVRETFEETGLAIGMQDHSAAAMAADAPASWRAYLALGLRPPLERLRFIFRAITPPTRPVRFDARFFIADTTDVAGDLDDFSGAEDELAHLQWLTVPEARRLDLPFITTVVLAELEARLAASGWPADRPVPFFHHDDDGAHVDGLV